MRAHIAIALIGMALIGTPSLHGQGVAQGIDSTGRVLDRRARVDLINSVLSERSRIFAQPMLIERCYLARVVGSSGNPVAGLFAKYRAEVVGAIAPVCEARPSERLAGDTVAIVFDRITFEADEYIPPDERLGPRLTGLIVVRLRVLDGSTESRIEEWVMRSAREGVWVVMTIRMFGFAVS